MKRKDGEDRIPGYYPTEWETYYQRKIDEEIRIHHSYLGWRIYFLQKRYSSSNRYELTMKFKQRFCNWNCEEKSNDELTLTDPYFGFPINVTFGNFGIQTPNKQRFSVMIQSQAFHYKRVKRRDHGNTCKMILTMLWRGKKKLFRMEEGGRLVPIPVTSMKYSWRALLGESYYIWLE